MVFDFLVRLQSSWPLKTGATIDDHWSHYNRSFMVLTLLSFGVVTTIRQYVGRHILCHGFEIFSEEFAEDYCWTQGIYTIKHAYDKPTDIVPYPGLIPEDIPTCQERQLKEGANIKCPAPQDIAKAERIYHLWYQWVPFYFYVTALVFYIPYLVLKQMGFHDMQPVLKLLDNPVQNVDDLQHTIDKAVNWLFQKCNIYYYKRTLSAAIFEKHFLGIILMFTKVLYLVISVFIFYLTSRMFAIGKYQTYGWDWIRDFNDGSYLNNTHVRHILFPKMVACSISRWGTSGIEEENGMCLLAPNVVNQYIFLILWFAYVLVIFLNITAVLVAIVALPLTKLNYRRFLLKSFVKDDEKIQKMYCNIGMSGRITLHLLATHTQPKIFEQVVRELTRQVLEVEEDITLHRVGQIAKHWRRYSRVH